MHIFSAIDFQKDRVVDGDLNVVKDLLLSNYCEVSQNKNNNEMVSSMKDVDENIVKNNSHVVITCEKEARKDVSGAEPMETNSISTNPVIHNCDLHDMKMEEQAPNHVISQKTCKRNTTVKSPNPNQVNTVKDSYEIKKLQNIIEDHIEDLKKKSTLDIFHKQMKSAILVGKFLAENGLCHNDIVPYLKNFMYYTHYLMCKLERLNCESNKCENAHTTEYDVQLQKQFRLDIDEVLRNMKLFKKGGVCQNKDIKCILCCIVHSKKEKVAIASKFEEHYYLDTKKLASNIGDSKELSGIAIATNSKLQFGNCKCQSITLGNAQELENESCCDLHEGKFTRNGEGLLARLKSAANKEEREISGDACTRRNSMTFNDWTTILPHLEEMFLKNPCQIDCERDDFGHEKKQKRGRTYVNQVH